MAADITSAAQLIENAPTIGIQCVSAGGGGATRAGAITAAVSNDKTNWVDVTFDSGATSITVTATTALNSFVNISNCGAQWIRVVFTDSTGGTGAGTLNAYMVLKP
jgi:hypothetical protein